MSQPIKAPKMVNSNELLEKLDKQNDLKTGHFIKIPDEIEQEVYEKGFYAYNWI
jgi:hypothetical protein